MTIQQGYDFFIQWHLTERCNLRCTHCYQEESRGDELQLSEIRETIDEISEMFEVWAELHHVPLLPGFTITGGEPFLHHDLFRILDEIRTKGFEVSLLSNGTLIDPECARTLADLGIKGVQVSIEGTETVHESIRGKGSFKAAIEGIRTLVGAGITVTMNVTLSRLNASGIPDLASLASELGVRRFGFSRLVPAGRGLRLMPEMLGAAQVRAVYKALSSLSREGLDIVSGDPLRAQMHDVSASGSGQTASGGCAAGISGLTILSDGTIMPCRRLPVPIGNVRNDSLRELWATSPALAALRDKKKYKGKCGRCSRWADCRGCRAIAYACSLAQGKGDFLADDPQCFIQG